MQRCCRGTYHQGQRRLCFQIHEPAKTICRETMGLLHFRRRPFCSVVCKSLLAENQRQMQRPHILQRTHSKRRVFACQIRSRDAQSCLRKRPRNKPTKSCNYPNRSRANRRSVCESCIATKLSWTRHRRHGKLCQILRR